MNSLRVYLDTVGYVGPTCSRVCDDISRSAKTRRAACENAAGCQKLAFLGDMD